MEVFSAIGGPDQLLAVNEAVNDSEPIVRLAAVDALQKIGERTGGKTLLQKLGDPDPHVRAAVTRALGRSGDKTVVPKLLPLLHDDNGFVRSAAAEALGKLGDRSAVPALITLLSGVEASGDDAGLVVKTKNDLLADKLKLTEIEQKAAIIVALGEMPAPEAVDPLIKYGLKSENLNLQATAAYSLGQIGDRRAINPLQDVVRDYYNTLAQMDPTGFVINPGTPSAAENQQVNREQKARVRAAVVWALGQIADPAARQTLNRALNDGNSLVRDNAAEALAKLQEKQEREQRAAVKPSKALLNERSATAPDKSRSASVARTP